VSTASLPAQPRFETGSTASVRCAAGQSACGSSGGGAGVAVALDARASVHDRPEDE